MELTTNDLRPGCRVRIIKEPHRTGTVVSPTEFSRHWGGCYSIGIGAVGVRWDGRSGQRSITQLNPRQLKLLARMEIRGNELILLEEE